MKCKIKSPILTDPKSFIEKDKNLSGYPYYPDNEDVFRNVLIDNELNPEDISKVKDFPKYDKSGNQNDIDDELGAGLDIPGIELDDETENIGGEDEENDYYSLGGDDHLDLDENQGE